MSGKEIIEKEKRTYIKKIFKILSEVNDLWLLNLLYEITYKVTREED